MGHLLIEIRGGAYDDAYSYPCVIGPFKSKAHAEILAELFPEIVALREREHAEEQISALAWLEAWEDMGGLSISWNKLLNWDDWMYQANINGDFLYSIAKSPFAEQMRNNTRERISEARQKMQDIEAFLLKLRTLEIEAVI